MNAIILAGGEQASLLPLSLGTPAAMLPLLGRPVMEHTVALLRRCGFTRLYAVMGREDRAVGEHFGDGSRLGVQLTCVERAGPPDAVESLRRCLALAGDAPALVISGRCVCDLDLRRAAEEHQRRGAAATLVLCRADGGGRGLAVTDGAGRVERLLEPPAWERGAAGPVFTGICVLSPGALARLPEGEPGGLYRGLLPALLRRGERLHSVVLEGGWREIEDCGSYLACVCDVLSGRLKADPGLPRRAPGIWSAEPVPRGVTLTPPCWIGPEVRLGRGCLIGPYGVLERGAVVGERAAVRRSVLMPRAAVGGRAALCGAVLCRDAAARRDAVLSEGAVLGENALAEEGAVLLERVCLWPGQRAPAGCRLSRSVTSGSMKGTLRFGDGGVIRGVLGEDLGPESLLTLGSVLGAEGRVGLGCSDSPGARMLARAAAAGIAAAGGTPVTHGLDCPVLGAWLARDRSLPVSLFVEEWGGEGQIFLRLFDRLGLPPERETQLRLERAAAGGELRRVRGDRVGRLERLEVSAEQAGAAAARQAALRGLPLRRVTAAVGCGTPEDRAVREALLALGCRLEDRWRPGIPAFSASHGGFRLAARDERGALLDAGQLLTLVVLIEMENGTGRAAVPAGATAAVELVAAGCGGSVLRLGRDGPQARALWGEQPWLWSAPAAAARICARMGTAGQRLETLISKTPRFSAWTREVPLSAHRGAVMEALARESGCAAQGEGLRLRAGGGWVYLAPLARRAALRVMAEGPDLELAAELCDLYARRAACLDRRESRRDAQED